VSDFALIDAIAQDQSDGMLDGSDGSAPVLITPSVDLPADATTIQLENGLQSFAASPANLTNLPVLPSIALRAPSIDLTGGHAFYALTTALPAFIDGVIANTPIVARGATGQTTCVLAGGQLPMGFTLAADCHVHYDGTPTLGSSSMEISGPFSVTMADSSTPAQTVTVELHITVITPPPVIHPHDGVCPLAGQPCDVFVATADGGVGPYSFYAENADFLGGQYPLGFFMKTIDSRSHIKPAPRLGNLSGDQGWMYDLAKAPALEATRAGSYTFQVCVVDSVGFEACSGDTSPTITVPPGPTPTPAPTPGSTKRPAATANNQPPDTQACIFSVVYPAWAGGGTLTESAIAPLGQCDSIIAQDSATFAAAGYAVSLPKAPPRAQPVCRLPNATMWGTEVTIWGTGTAGIPAAQALCAYYGP
jgi:hypothetical protein